MDTLRDEIMEVLAQEEEWAGFGHPSEMAESWIEMNFEPMDVKEWLSAGVWCPRTARSFELMEWTPGHVRGHTVTIGDVTMLASEAACARIWSIPRMDVNDPDIFPV